MSARNQSTSTRKVSSDRTPSSKPPQDDSLSVHGLNTSRASSSYGRRGRGLGGTSSVRVPPPSTEPISPSLLLRPTEVAEALGLSRSKVFELLAAQELPAVHIGRSTRVPRAQLESWIESQVHWEPRAPSGLLGRLHAREARTA